MDVGQHQNCFQIGKERGVESPTIGQTTAATGSHCQRHGASRVSYQIAQRLLQDKRLVHGDLGRDTVGGAEGVGGNDEIRAGGSGSDRGQNENNVPMDTSTWSVPQPVSPTLHSEN